MYFLQYQRESKNTPAENRGIFYAYGDFSSGNISKPYKKAKNREI
jgi:hypothetical protein